MTGQGLYVGDIAHQQMAHAVVVRAQVASARITAIDAEAALASPGVLAVYTAKDLAADGLPDFPCDVDVKRPERPEGPSGPAPRARSRSHSHRRRAGRIRRCRDAGRSQGGSRARRRRDAGCPDGGNRGRGSRLRRTGRLGGGARQHRLRLEEGRCGGGNRASVRMSAELTSHISRVAALSLEPRGGAGPGRRGRSPRAPCLQSEPAHIEARACQYARGAGRSGARGRQGCRRLVRHEERGISRGRARALRRAQARTSGALDLGAPRELPCRRPRSRHIHRRQACGGRRRPLAGVEGRFHGQRRLLPVGAVAVHAEQHRRHRRRLPDPQHRGHHHRRLHQHDDQRALSRRRPARGHLRHRAADRHCGARVGARSLRAAPAQPGAAVGHALRHRISLQVRLRRVRGQHAGRSQACRPGGLRGPQGGIGEAGHAARARHGEPDRGRSRSVHQAAEGFHQARGPSRRDGDGLCGVDVHRTGHRDDADRPRRP